MLHMIGTHYCAHSSSRTKCELQTETTVLEATEADKRRKEATATMLARSSSNQSDKSLWSSTIILEGSDQPSRFQKQGFSSSSSKVPRELSDSLLSGLMLSFFFLFCSTTSWSLFFFSLVEPLVGSSSAVFSSGDCRNLSRSSSREEWALSVSSRSWISLLERKLLSLLLLVSCSSKCFLSKAMERANFIKVKNA